MPANFFDAHIHLWEYALFNYFTNLQKITSIAEITAKLQANPVKGWLVGVRFNQEDLAEKTIPDRELLDKLFGAQPTIIIRTCLHLAIMNTVAMERLKCYSPNGIFLEADVFSILNLLTKQLDLDPAQIVQKGLAELNKLGITRVIDMAMSPFKQRFFQDVDFKHNGLVRIDYYTTNFKILEEALGYKIFLDGGLGVRTAALTEEYTDQPGNYGTLNYSDEDVETLVKKIHQLNKPVAIHAIGDRAVDQFIRVIESNRHPLDRLEHVQYARPEQIEILANMQIPVCIQPIFSREIAWASQRLGAKRMETAYAWNLMHEKGIYLLAGSDAPVDEIDPLVSAAEVAILTGNQHLSYEKTLELYTTNNWKLYQ